MTTAPSDIAPAAYRLPEATRLGPVHLEIADLPRSLDFYQGILGFRALDREASRATLGVRDSETPLIILQERPGAKPAPRRARLGLYHFAILLPDRAALGRLVAHLGRIGARVGASDHLVSEALYLHDPDGLGIEIYSDRPRAVWQRREGELEMGTLPLDLDDLVAVAQGAAWSEMPAGTVVGHMHLHVGDIEVARAFFDTGLGLDATVTRYPGALFLAAGGYHHHLGVNTWAGADAPRPQAGDARLLEWTVIVPSPADVEAAARSMKAVGVEVDRAGDHASDGWRATDPWGTALRVIFAE